MRAGIAAVFLFFAVLEASGQPAPVFEVASIKPSTPQERVIGMFVYPGGRLTITNYTLRMLIHDAYGVEDYQISGGPKWAGEDRYSIEAKPPTDSKSAKVNPANIKLPPEEEELSMLRSLLAERFQLTVQRESTEGSFLALVVDSHGPKLTEARDKDAFPFVGGGRTGNAERPDFMNGANVSMARLAAGLSQRFRRPVLDQTGLTGTFDFRIEYAASLSDSTDGPSLSTAIQQLGLKLMPAKGPVVHLVIDHAEKPSGN
jgi:uncharacterized protein (TIGR03435 family)